MILHHVGDRVGGHRRSVVASVGGNRLRRRSHRSLVVVGEGAARYVGGLEWDQSRIRLLAAVCQSAVEAAARSRRRSMSRAASSLAVEARHMGRLLVDERAGCHPLSDSLLGEDVVEEDLSGRRRGETEALAAVVL